MFPSPPSSTASSQYSILPTVCSRSLTCSLYTLFKILTALATSLHQGKWASGPTRGWSEWLLHENGGASLCLPLHSLPLDPAVPKAQTPTHATVYTSPQLKCCDYTTTSVTPDTTIPSQVFSCDRLSESRLVPCSKEFDNIFSSLLKNPAAKTTIFSKSFWHLFHWVNSTKNSCT